MAMLGRLFRSIVRDPIQRLIISIARHPYRSIVSAVLILTALALLFPAAAPFALPAFLSPLGAWLQATFLTAGTGWGWYVLANTIAAMAVSTFAYYIPKLTGNILQFVGKRIIEDFVGALSTIPYLVARDTGAWGIKYPFLALAWFVAQLGKTVNTLGQFISGEYHLRGTPFRLLNRSRIGKNRAVTIAVPSPVRMSDSEDEDDQAVRSLSKVREGELSKESEYAPELNAVTKYCSSAKAFIQLKMAIVKDVYNNPNDAQVTSHEDEAIISPDAGRCLAGVWVRSLTLLGRVSPVKSYDVMRAQERIAASCYIRLLGRSDE